MVSLSLLPVPDPLCGQGEGGIVAHVMPYTYIYLISLRMFYARLRALPDTVPAAGPAWPSATASGSRVTGGGRRQPSSQVTGTDSPSNRRDTVSD